LVWRLALTEAFLLANGEFFLLGDILMGEFFLTEELAKGDAFLGVEEERGVFRRVVFGRMCFLVNRSSLVLFDRMDALYPKSESGEFDVFSELDVYSGERDDIYIHDLYILIINK
jgi:hypothetical protein